MVFAIYFDRPSFFARDLLILTIAMITQLRTPSKLDSQSIFRRCRRLLQHHRCNVKLLSDASAADDDSRTRWARNFPCTLPCTLHCSLRMVQDRIAGGGDGLLAHGFLLQSSGAGLGPALS